jgi:hypothetical protein
VLLDPLDRASTLDLDGKPGGKKNLNVPVGARGSGQKMSGVLTLSHQYFLLTVTKNHQYL